MATIKEKVARRRKELEKLGLPKRAILGQLMEMVKREAVATKARLAFDIGIPVDQGPIWFGEEEWKTDFWTRQWEWQKAYREGETARAEFGDQDDNPYRQEGPPYTSRLFELEAAWNNGFRGEEL